MDARRPGLVPDEMGVTPAGEMGVTPAQVDCKFRVVGCGAQYSHTSDAYPIMLLFCTDLLLWATYG